MLRERNRNNRSRFRPQNPAAERHNFKTVQARKLDFTRFPTAFRADDNR